MSSFQKTPASHWPVNTYSALSFEQISFKICLYNLRTEMLTLPFQILAKLCFNENEADVETDS